MRRGHRHGLARPFFRISRGGTSSPPLATAEQACASCSVVTPTSCPMDTDISEVVRHFASLRTIPGDSAGSGIPVREPRPKRRTYSYSLFEPTLQPDLDGADVAGFRQHHLHGHGAVAVMGLVHRTAGHREGAVAAIDHAGGLQVGGFQRGRKRDDLEHGAWLEGHRDRVIETRRFGLLSARGRLVRIERRIAGDGQNLAGIRVHHHHAAAFGVRSLHCARDRLLGRQLDAFVDAQHHVRARPRDRSSGFESMPRPFASVSMRTLPGKPRRSNSRLFSSPHWPVSSLSTAPITCAASVLRG